MAIWRFFRCAWFARHAVPETRLSPSRRRTRNRRPGLILLLLSGLAWHPMPSLAQCVGNPDPARISAPAGAPCMAAILTGFDALAGSTLAESAVPGMAIVVVHDDRIVYLKGFGVRTHGRPDMVDADTVFPLASLSKPIASTIIAATLNDAKQWNTPIASLDPTFMVGDALVSSQLTLADLLSHRSGLAPFAGDFLEELGYSRRQVLERLRFLPLTAALRERHQYGNFAFSEASFAVARSRGVAWESMADTLLFRPLDMRSTSARHADFLTRANRVSSHVLVDGVYRPVYDRNPDPQAPAGGVSTSARDLGAWLRLQLGNGRIEGRQLIDAAVLAASREPAIETSPASQSGEGSAQYYALGWGRRQDGAGRIVLSHSGAFGRGAATSVIMLPSERLAIAVLTNAAPVGLAEALSNEFIERALDGAASRDWFAFLKPQMAALLAPRVKPGADYNRAPSLPRAALPLSAYTGRYASNYYGTLEIVQQQDGLAMLLGPLPIHRKLRHWNGNVFVDAHPGMPAPDPDAVDTGPGDLDIHYLGGLIFYIGSDGRAASVDMEELDQHGEGGFVRVPQ